MSIYYRADIIHSNGTMSPLERTNITENQLILKIENKKRSNENDYPMIRWDTTPADHSEK